MAAYDHATHARADQRGRARVRRCRRLRRAGRDRAPPARAGLADRSARKIGFTNRTIWSRYGVYQPMWAHVWTHTVQFAPAGRATLLARRPGAAAHRARGRVQAQRAACRPPTMRRRSCAASSGSPPASRSSRATFPDWKFTAADCTAAFGLHGALVVGAPVADHRRAIARRSRPRCRRSRCSCGAAARSIDTGVGANVLGSPALALAHLARVLATQPWAPPLAAGEIDHHRHRHRRVAGRGRARRGRATTARWVLRGSPSRSPEFAPVRAKWRLAPTRPRQFTTRSRCVCQSMIDSSGYSAKCVCAADRRASPPTARRNSSINSTSSGGFGSGVSIADANG